MKLSKLIESLQKYRADFGDAELEYEVNYHNPYESVEPYGIGSFEDTLYPMNLHFKSFKRGKKIILALVLS